MNTLTPRQKNIIHNCLLDLRDSSSLTTPSFLPATLDKLVTSEGFGIDMSGIYLSTDEDFENIPEYLKEGIAFEFMGEHVVLSFSDGASVISNWCDNNAISDRESILLKCKILKAKFSTED
ncbi:hypothetical protein F2A38_00565 [Pseudomonas chlororaphis]|uniref:CdiI immunity protein domain-containing protein n=1 Tax=Pseudomonas chlororaphis TaxID=587753 RepID=A0AB34CCJ9_9PSED|nr:hypothetical protein [Pseudomonas chlororaphis]KAA5845343.1 hypothetical protein F2A38_00565 [Pseudomonas chlororaphis]